jgi:hypothetical protein
MEKCTLSTSRYISYNTVHDPCHMPVASEVTLPFAYHPLIIYSVEQTCKLVMALLLIFVRSIGGSHCYFTVYPILDTFAFFQFASQVLMSFNIINSMV